MEKKGENKMFFDTVFEQFDHVFNNKECDIVPEIVKGIHC